MDRRVFLKYAIGFFLCNASTRLENAIGNTSFLEYKADLERKINESLAPTKKLINDKINYALLVEGKSQKMYLARFENDKFVVEKEYPISTGIGGYGNEFESAKTPLGLHKIVNKYGDNAAIGEVFKARVSTKKIVDIYDGRYEGKPAITTRILQLEGLEEINKNTYARYVYIHGTSQEKYIGRPASGGCIRMRNKDVIELYNLVEIGNPLNIIIDFNKKH